jgi:molybdopterin converting factor small subunit
LTATLLLPAVLRPTVGGQAAVATEAATVGEALDRLADQWPQLERRLRDEQGHLRQHVRLYLGDTDIADLDGMATRLSDGARLHIIPAVSGGSC